jgi:hypothetical protein
LYELASGESPFAGNNFADSIQKILEKSAPPLYQVRPDLPTWFSDEIAKMLQKTPQERPASAKSILQIPGFKQSAFHPEKLAAFITDPSSYRSESREIEAAASSPEPLPQRRYFVAAAFVALLAIMILPLFFSSHDAFKNTRDGRLANDVIHPVSPGLEDTLPANPSLNITETETFTSPKAPLAGENEKTIPAWNGNDSGFAEITENDSGAPLETPVGKTGFMENGEIFIICSPWAEVMINGEKKETTPLLKPISLPPGEYELALENPNFQTYRRQIVIQSGKLDSVVINLQPLNGYLKLLVIPWAKVYINGDYYETTPLEKTISLPAGKYELMLTNPNYPTWADSIEIIAGKTISQEISLGGEIK